MKTLHFQAIALILIFLANSAVSAKDADDSIESVRESATPVRVREGQTETVALKLPPLP